MQRTSAAGSLTVLSLFFCQPAFSQDGLQLFHKMQEALGGAKKIAAIRDFEQSVRAESWNGNTGQSLGEVRKRTRWIRPSYLRADQVGPGSHMFSTSMALQVGRFCRAHKKSRSWPEASCNSLRSTFAISC